MNTGCQGKSFLASWQGRSPESMFRVIQKAAFFTEDNLRAIALVGGKYPNMFFGLNRHAALAEQECAGYRFRNIRSIKGHFTYPFDI